MDQRSHAGGLSKYRKDTQTAQRQAKTHKDGKKTFEVDKDTQRRTKHSKIAKRCLKLTKTPKDRQRHAKTTKRYLKLTKTRKDGKKIFNVDKDTQRRQKDFKIVFAQCGCLCPVFEVSPVFALLCMSLHVFACLWASLRVFARLCVSLRVFV